MKCQILFYGKNKKNIINLLFVEFAQRVVKVKDTIQNILSYKFELLMSETCDLQVVLR